LKTVLLISGKQGSGKTTTAEAIYRALTAPGAGFGFVDVKKFAGHLYKIHEFVLNYMERITGKPRVIKDGYFLQWLGTEYGRKI
jgi:pantothenate kinase-related protein Tda10